MLPQPSPNRPHFVALVVLLLCGAALARAGALIGNPTINDHRPTPESVAALSNALVADSPDLPLRLSNAGVTRVERLRFDKSAAVVLTYGADNKPGQAGKDDNLDEIVDNTAETGAVGSDDQCLAPWDAAYTAATHRAGTLTISKGTFVAANGDSEGGDNDRFLIQGSHGSWDWTWMLIR